MNRIDIIHIEDSPAILVRARDVRPSVNDFAFLFDGQPQNWMGRVSTYQTTFGESSTSDGIAELKIVGDFGELRLNTRHVAVNMRAEVIQS
jgi:hypothetical protein